MFKIRPLLITLLRMSHIQLEACRVPANDSQLDPNEWEQGGSKNWTVEQKLDPEAR
jgi:hypothetical protein